MSEYQLNILQDESQKQRLIVIQSGAPIDMRLLQIAGLILDGGYSDEEVSELLPSAQSYVEVHDLLPVEQQAESRFKIGEFGGYDVTDDATAAVIHKSVQLITALTAELERWRTMHGADNVEDSIVQDARGNERRLLADRLNQIRRLTAESDQLRERYEVLKGMIEIVQDSRGRRRCVISSDFTLDDGQSIDEAVSAIAASAVNESEAG